MAYAPSSRKDMVLEANIGFAQTGYQHRRKNYSIIEIMGDLGGVSELLTVVIGFFIMPISRHSFIMKVLRKSFVLE